MYIDSTGANPVVFQSQSERGLVDKTSTRGVHQESSRAHLKPGSRSISPQRYLVHLFDGVLVDQVVVVLVEGAVEGDAVRLEEQVLQRVDALEAQALLNPIGQVGVVEDHVEPKGFRSQSHS